MSTSPRQMPPSPNDAETKEKREDRRRRYTALMHSMDEWSREPRAIDDEIEPLIEQFLRETAPRLFPDD